MTKMSCQTFTYPEDYNEEECEEFINHFKNLAYHISHDILSSKNLYFGLDLMRSAALEGCFKAYIVSKKVEAKDYTHKKGLVRMCVKNTFWSMAVMFGYLPSSGQIFFPTGWVDFNDYFKDRSDACSQDIYNKIDVKILNDLVESMPEKESEIHQLYMSGYDFAEIGRRLGYKSKSSPLLMHARTLERVKERMQPPKDCGLCGSKFRIGEGCGNFCSKFCSNKNRYTKYNQKILDAKKQRK